MSHLLVPMWNIRLLSF